MDVEERVRVALEMIPTCERCKRLRRKCDTELPSCRLCEAADQICVFRDQVLQEDVPRRSSLHLPDIDIADPNSQLKELLDRWTVRRRAETSPAVHSSSGLEPDSQSASPRFDFDALFPSSDHKDGSSFFGSSSVQVLSAELLAAVCPQSALLRQSNMTKPATYGGGRLVTDIWKNETPHILPSEELVLHLIDVHNRSCMVFWPYTVDRMDQARVDGFLRFTQDKGLHPRQSTKQQMRSNFQIAMICSIAAAHSARFDSAMKAYEQFFYHHALRLMKEVLSEATHESLTGLMLIMAYLLFRPQQGDLWQLLGSACRLAIELGYHREDAPGLESWDHKAGRSSTFWTLYGLEQAISEIYGRPSDDMDTITTIELPITFLPISATASNMSTDGGISSALASLSVIRSDIFKTIYLPTSTLSVHMDDVVYQHELTKLEHWHRNAAATMTGALSDIAIKIAYHSTIIFLFQKSLLHVLSSIRGVVNNHKGHVDWIAVHSFSSACELLNTYQLLVRSEEDSPLSKYPMTLIAAHEIFIAGLTLMAYCHCLLEGHVNQQPRNGSLQPAMPPYVSLMDHDRTRDLLNLSSICVSLLTWCSTQWPGMDGMLEIYQELSTTLLPRMFRNGLA